MFNSDKDNNTPTEQILPDHISLEKSKMYFISDLHIGDGSQSEPLKKQMIHLCSKWSKMVFSECLSKTRHESIQPHSKNKMSSNENFI